MAIADKLKKAASLFINFDESQANATPSAKPSPVVETPPPGGNMTEDDLDRRLREMNASMQQLNRGGTATTTTPPPNSAEPPKTIDDLLKASDGPSLSEISVSSQSITATKEDGSLDFPAIYTAAALPSTPYSAEEMLELLSGLPANLPLDIKRQTVSITIGSLGKSIGATPETIVADASRKLAALAAYEADNNKNANDFIEAAEFEISTLEQQIEEKRKAILDSKQRAAEVSRLCDTEADRLDDVLEFFSLDVGASRYAGTTPPPLPTTPPPLPTP